jgi:hypothetical protein
MTDGMGKLCDTERSLYPFAGLTISLLFKKTRINARSTEQTISGLLSWLSTNTLLFI